MKNGVIQGFINLNKTFCNLVRLADRITLEGIHTRDNLCQRQEKLLLFLKF